MLHGAEAVVENLCDSNDTILRPLYQLEACSAIFLRLRGIASACAPAVPLRRAAYMELAQVLQRRLRRQSLEGEPEMS